MMTVFCEGRDYGYELAGVAMLFFRGEKVIPAKEGEEPLDNFILAETSLRPGRASLSVTVEREERTWEASEIVPVSEENPDHDCELHLARMLYQILSEITGITPKWGVLTGIRPVKLVQRRLDQGFSREEVARELREDYLVSQEKLDLAFATQQKEHAILSRNTPDSFSLYISIPFCPSRCLYCSFVSHSIEKTYKLMDQYIDCLCQEIAHTAEVARQAGLRLRTVYFGGGTPTSITAEQLKKLTDCVAEHFDLSEVWEYTIEAGRPDTITREKLQVIRDAGVTRISINPQTFNDDVLRFVGRKHPAQAVVDCYEMARELGFDNINMDIIAGLPTDTLDSFRHTVERLLELGPENITVHTLSVKRSADLSGEKAVDLSSLTGDVTEMVDYAQRRLMENGYEPYYLYRQRNILDNLENTGYCKPGKEGLYNVYIMDETHTILACGAGGVSKLRDPHGDDIKRLFNFKYPYEYISRFEEILQRKDETLAFYQSHPIEGTKS